MTPSHAARKYVHYTTSSFTVEPGNGVVHLVLALRADSNWEESAKYAHRFLSEQGFTVQSSYRQNLGFYYKPAQNAGPYGVGTMQYGNAHNLGFNKLRLFRGLATADDIRSNAISGGYFESAFLNVVINPNGQTDTDIARKLAEAHQAIHQAVNRELSGADRLPPLQPTDHGLPSTFSMPAESLRR